jgi:hypothetical protein
MNYTLELQKVMTEGHYLIALRDNFENLLSRSVLNIIERKIDGEEIDSTMKNKIFGVVVECVQNICSSEEQNASRKDSVLLIRRVDNGYMIEVGTLIHGDRKQRLDDLINNLIHMDEVSMRQQKNDILSVRDELTLEQRDFLALTDIRLRSEGNMKYRMEEHDGTHFLVLEITILKN